jgi:hypothetical protein
MSVSVCDITIPADYCPPVVLRLAAKITQLERELEEWKGKYTHLLMSGKPNVVPKLPVLTVSEFFGKKNIDDLTKYQLALFMKNRISSEAGAEVCLATVIDVYREWSNYHPAIPRMYGKLAKQTLYELMKTHFGEPVRNALSPSGAITIAAVFTGCKIEEEDV